MNKCKKTNRGHLLIFTRVHQQVNRSSAIKSMQSRKFEICAKLVKGPGLQVSKFVKISLYVSSVHCPKLQVI